MWARLNSPDATLIETSVEELARSVCDGDPRSMNERRTAALTALAARTGLVCACGQPDCPGAPSDRPAKNAVVYVVADEKSVDAATSSGSESQPVMPAAGESPRGRESEHAGVSAARGDRCDSRRVRRRRRSCSAPGSCPPRYSAES